MKSLRLTLVSALGALLATAVFHPAMAASTWAFGAGSGNCGTAAVYEVCAKTSYTSAETSLTIDGVYAVNNGVTGNAQGNWYQKSLTYFSGGGLGMPSDGTDAPNHGLDNNGNTEGVLLKFASSVALTQITLGYVNTDSDLRIFRWAGAGAPTIVGSAVKSSAATGWQLVSSGPDDGNDVPANVATNVNGAGLTSTWWLVTAYNQTFGETYSQGNDFFKLLAVTTTCASTTTGGACGTSRVPEPASLALVSLALVGVMGARRRPHRR